MTGSDTSKITQIGRGVTGDGQSPNFTRSSSNTSSIVTGCTICICLPATTPGPPGDSLWTSKFAGFSIRICVSLPITTRLMMIVRP